MDREGPRIFLKIFKNFLTLLLLLLDTSWHFLTCLGASWRRLSSFLMSSSLLLDDSWADLPILGKKEISQEQARSRREKSRGVKNQSRLRHEAMKNSTHNRYFSFLFFHTRQNYIMPVLAAGPWELFLKGVLKSPPPKKKKKKKSSPPSRSMQLGCCSWAG